jgi:hypothetical protein
MTETDEIVSAIVSHHAELQASLHARVDAVLAATLDGAPHDNAVADLGLLL